MLDKDSLEKIKESIKFDLRHLGTVEEEEKHLKEQLAKHEDIRTKHLNEIKLIENMSSEEFNDYAIKKEKETLKYEKDLLSQYDGEIEDCEKNIRTCKKVLSMANSEILKVKVSKEKSQKEYMLKNIQGYIDSNKKRIEESKRRIKDLNNMDEESLNAIKRSQLLFVKDMLKTENELIKNINSGNGMYNRTINIIKEDKAALAELDKVKKELDEEALDEN